MKKPVEKAMLTESSSSGQDFLLSSAPPEFPPARRIVNPADATGLKITLYQYQPCPFCCKTRAFLDYFGFSYDVIEVNSVMRTQVAGRKKKFLSSIFGSFRNIGTGPKSGKFQSLNLIM